MTRRPSPGDRLSAADVVYHDGTVAIAGAVVHCGACGREVDVNGELTLTPPVESGDDG
jgi:hypothetical protein